LVLALLAMAGNTLLRQKLQMEWTIWHTVVAGTKRLQI
jgi:hypothetical protein